MCVEFVLTTVSTYYNNKKNTILLTDRGVSRR